MPQRYPDLWESSDSDFTRKTRRGFASIQPETQNLYRVFLNDTFRWVRGIRPNFLHEVPKGKFTPEVHAFLEQRNAHKRSQGVLFLSTQTNWLE